MNDLRVVSAVEYGRQSGFAVEQLRYVSWSDDRQWVIPGWVEDRWGHSGFFDTEVEAESFIEMVTA